MINVIEQHLESGQVPAERLPTSKNRFAPAWLDWATTLVVLIASAIIFATPLRQHGSMLQFAQDDLYYYLIAARNIVHGLGSTFDGITPTNGYHPLYMMFFIAAAHFTTSLKGTYEALWGLDMLSAMTTLFAVRALVRRQAANPWLTNGCAVAILLLFYHRIFQQMEVTLTVPLGLLFVLALDYSPRAVRAKHWALIGVLAALMMLSRLDSALLILLIGTATLLVPQTRRALTFAKVAALFAGFLPLPLLYFVVNEHYFHRLMPISGSAKQLRTGHGFYMPAVFNSLSNETIAMFILAIVAIAYLPLLWHRLRPELQVISLAALAFPFLHWGLNFYLSDWKLWPWYRYSLILAMVVTLLMAVVAVETWLAARYERLLGPAILVVSLLCLVTTRYEPDYIMVDISQAAAFVHQFATTHPGRYAMGDRAGMVAYTIGQPMIQTEGLMMDAAFLDRIRRSQPLLQMLRDYHIDYYVIFDWKQTAPWPIDSCIKAREPYQAGPQSPSMNALICQPPMAQDMEVSGRTLIFDVHTLHSEQ